MSRVRVGISQRKSPWLSPLKTASMATYELFYVQFRIFRHTLSNLGQQWSADPSISPTYIPSFVKSPSIDVNCGYMSCSEEETEGQGSTQRDLLESVGPFVKLGITRTLWFIMFLPTDSLPSHKSTHPHPIVWGGVGWEWGGVGWDDNVIGISTWTWCHALWSSLAFPHDPDATLYDLRWHFHMIWMLRSMIFIGISTWSWCYAPWSSIAIPHIRIR